MKIETERLLLRLMRLDDLDDSFEHRADPYVCRYVGNPINKQQVKERIIEAIKPWNGGESEKLFLAIELKQENKLIGELMFKFLDVENQVGEIGYRLNQNYQSKGYAYEATSTFIEQLFQQVNVHKITAFCDTDNQASWRLMEKLGMHKEGLLRAHYKIRDEWRDAFLYATLNE